MLYRYVVTRTGLAPIAELPSDHAHPLELVKDPRNIASVFSFHPNSKEAKPPITNYHSFDTRKQFDHLHHSLVITPSHHHTIPYHDFAITPSCYPVLSVAWHLLTFVAFSERKIDLIEARLGSIESLLKNLAHPFGTSAAGAGNDMSRNVQTPQTGSSAPTCESSADLDSGDEDESSFAGDSGLTAHTAFASEFLERAVKRTSLRSPNPKMEAAVANLSQLVDMQKRSNIAHKPRFPLQRPIPPGGVTKLSLPPMATVVDLLKRNKCKSFVVRLCVFLIKNIC